MQDEHDLRAHLVRIAAAHPDVRGEILAILRSAKEFPSEKALETYLQEHPNADESKHTVKETGGKGKGESDDAGEGKAKPDEGKADSGSTSKVKVKIDEKKLEERRPKVESEDLTGYPPDADAEDLTPKHREEIADYKLEIVGDDARQAVEIARKVKEGIAKGSDICKLNPPICEGNMGLTRDKMPQIEGEKTVKQMLESKNELDRKKGQAMVQAGADPDSDKTVLQHMLDHLAENGVTTEETEVPVGALKATQSEIKAEKVYGMADAHLKGKFDKIDASVVVSRDGHILDGHHRWAALLAIDPSRKMKVKVIDMDMKDLLEESQAVPGVYKADFEGNPLGEDDQKKYKSDAKSKFKGKGQSKKASTETVTRMHNPNAWGAFGAGIRTFTVPLGSRDAKYSVVAGHGGGYYTVVRVGDRKQYVEADGATVSSPQLATQHPSIGVAVSSAATHATKLLRSGLRAAAIHLARENPDIRPHLLAILAEE